MKKTVERSWQRPVSKEVERKIKLVQEQGRKLILAAELAAYLTESELKELVENAKITLATQTKINYI